MADDKWAQYAVKPNDEWSKYAVATEEAPDPTKPAPGLGNVPGKPASGILKPDEMKYDESGFIPLPVRRSKAEWDKATKLVEQKKPEIDQFVKDVHQGAASIAGAEVGSGVMAGVAKGTEKVAGSKVASYLLPKVARAVGSGVGATVGDVAAGASPEEAKKQGATFGTMDFAVPIFAEGMGKVVGGTFKKLAGPFLEKMPVKPEPVSPSGAFFPLEGAIPKTEAELADGIVKGGKELVQIGDAEAALRDSVVKAPQVIRQTFNQIYPTIDAPINIRDLAMRTAKGAGDLAAHGTPGPLAKTVGLADRISKAEESINKLLEENPGLLDEEMDAAGVTGALRDLKNMTDMPFQRVKQLKNAIGTMMAKGEGYKIPGEQYKLLQSVQGDLKEMLQMAADNAGKGQQYAQADMLFSKFMNDFYNKGAPLKGVLNIKEGMTGKTLRYLTRPENLNRAEEALRRWGMKDQADVLRKIADTPNSAKKIADMERLLSSPRAYGEEEMAAAKASDAKRLSAVDKRNQILQKKADKAVETASALTEKNLKQYEERRKALQDARRRRLIGLGVGAAAVVGGPKVARVARGLTKQTPMP